jgi:hypothetical protein
MPERSSETDFDEEAQDTSEPVLVVTPPMDDLVTKQ